MDQNLRPDPRLERHILGETPKHLAESTKRALERPDAADRLRALRESDAEILAALPPERMAEAIRHRALPPSRQRSWMSGLVMAGLALGISATAYFLLPIRGGSDVPNSHLAHAAGDTIPHGTVVSDSVKSANSAGISRPHDTAAPARAGSVAAVDSAKTPDTAGWEVAWADDDILLKGHARRLAIHRIGKNVAEALRLSDGDSAASGDLLQVGTLSGARRYVAILSLDGRGQITRHIPESGDSAILATSSLEAPHSYQLDDAPVFERFVLVESRNAFDLASIETLLKKAGANGHLHRSGVRFESVQLRKKP